MSPDCHSFRMKRISNDSISLLITLVRVTNYNINRFNTCVERCVYVVCIFDE